MAKANKLIPVVDGTAGTPIELIDSRIDINNPTNEDVLMYNSLSGKFEANSIGAVVTEVALTGDYDDLTNQPTIPAAQVNSDWNASSGVAQILNKPTIPTELDDLSDVAILSPSDQQTLVYNSSTQDFENGEQRKLWDNVDIRAKLGVDYISHNNYIAPATGEWVTTDYQHYAVPINGIRYVTLVQNTTRPGRYSFLKTYTVGETGMPDYATGYTTAIVIETGATASAVVPVDANYLYFYARDNNSSTPDHIYFTGTGITEHKGNGNGFIKDNGGVDNTSYQPALPSYTGNSGKVLTVNSGETGVEWVTQSGSGTEEVLVCNYDISNHTMDKTITDIYNAYTAGKIIVCKSNTTVYYLETCVDVSCRFHAVQNTGQLLSFKYIKYLNGTWSEGQDDWNSKQDKLIGTQTTGQNIKTVNGNSLLGSGDLIIGGVTIYSGSTTPSSSTGSDGDIYIQTAS